VGDRGNILDLADINTSRLQRPNGSLATRTGPLGENVHLGHTKLLSLTRNALRGQLSGKASAFFCPGEANCATTSPAQRITARKVLVW